MPHDCNIARMAGGESRDSLTVIIGCFNEEANLGPTHSAVRDALSSAGISDFEIIIVDDCSTDATPEVAHELAQKDPQTKVVRNAKNRGFGYSLIVGLEMGTKSNFTVVPGDNEIRPESLKAIFAAVGQAEIIVAYPTNLKARPLVRILLSRTFVWLMNILFRCRLNYYNGPNVYPVNALQQIDIDVSGFAFNAIILVKLIRAGHTVMQVPMQTRTRKSWKSNAVKLSSIVSVLRDIGRFFREVYFPVGM